MPSGFSQSAPVRQSPGSASPLDLIYAPWFTGVSIALTSITMFGTTAQRPTKNVFIGQIYFDTTIGRPVWCVQLNPIVWVDLIAGGGAGSFASLVISGNNANSFLYSGPGGSVVTTAQPSLGQLLIGTSVGSAPALGKILAASPNITVSYSGGNILIDSSSSSPNGPATSIQYNNFGVFGGSSKFLVNPLNTTLYIDSVALHSEASTIGGFFLTGRNGNTVSTIPDNIRITAGGKPATVSPLDTTVTTGSALLLNAGGLSSGGSWDLRAGIATDLVTRGNGTLRGNILILQSQSDVLIGAGSSSLDFFNTGELQINSQPGTAGQVITSAGGGASILWTSVVNSIVGTTDRITVSSATGDVTVDIAGTYVGQTSITTLGTITTGVWNGTTIAITDGGTGQTSKTPAFDALSPLSTLGDLLTFDGTNNVRLPVGTDTDVLTMVGGVPTWAPEGHIGDVTSVDLTSSTLDVSGAPITSAGTIVVDLPVTGVTPGPYTNTDLTVDAYGRITAASNGTGGTGTPAAPFTSIQFNDSGAFGGDARFTFDTLLGELRTFGALWTTAGGPAYDLIGNLDSDSGDGSTNIQGGYFLVTAGSATDTSTSNVANGALFGTSQGIYHAIGVGPFGAYLEGGSANFSHGTVVLGTGDVAQGGGMVATPSTYNFTAAGLLEGARTVFNGGGADGVMSGISISSIGGSSDFKGGTLDTGTGATTGGDAIINGGDTVYDETGTPITSYGAKIVLKGATDDFASAHVSGDMVVQTANTDRLTIDKDGTWILAADPGTTGDVLTSSGAAAAPVWAAPAFVAPNYEAQIATALQTVFNTTVNTTAAGAGKSYLQVFVNGVFSEEGGGLGYTVTGANQITMTAGVTAGFRVVLYAFS